MHDKKSDEISEIINRADESCDTNAANKLNEATVKKALTKRAAYLRKNSEYEFVELILSYLLSVS